MGRVKRVLRLRWSGEWWSGGVESGEVREWGECWSENGGESGEW